MAGNTPLTDIMNALSRLLAEPAEKETETERLREDELLDGFALAKGTCEDMCFETKVREGCVEINKIECKKVDITNFRTEIQNRCKTLFDQTCNVTYNDVPAHKCFQKQRNKYKDFILYF